MYYDAYYQLLTKPGSHVWPLIGKNVPIAQGKECSGKEVMVHHLKVASGSRHKVQGKKIETMHCTSLFF
jgi:hypothetical protein